MLYRAFRNVNCSVVALVALFDHLNSTCFCSLVTRWEAPGGFGASSGLWLANFSFSTLMLLVRSFDL